MTAIALLGTFGINSTGGGSNPFSCTQTLATGANRKAIAYVGCENAVSRTCTGVTYGGIAMIKAIDITVSGAAVNYGSIWYLDEAALGTLTPGVITCTATLSGVATDAFVEVRTLQGIQQGAPLQTASTGEASPPDSTIENTVRAIGVPQWAFSYSQCANTGSFSAGGSQVSFDAFNTGSMCNQMADLRGGASETTLASTFTGTLNRLLRIVAAWTSADAAVDRLVLGSPSLVL